jgi:hypothetical protein
MTMVRKLQQGSPMSREELLANPIAIVMLDMISELAKQYAIATVFSPFERSYPTQCAIDEPRYELSALADGHWTQERVAFGETVHGAGDAAVAKIREVFAELRRRVAELSLETTQVPS